MQDDFHIFRNIATNENQVTEILCNFLCYKNFRDSFLSTFLPDIDAHRIEHQDLQTQVRIEDFIPDLVIRNDDYELLFEVKVGDAPLQHTQTSNYPDYLATLDKTTKLCFIIPRDYHKLNELKSLTSSRIGVNIIYWDEIINLIENKTFDTSNQLFDEFSKLLKDWFEHKKISFTLNQTKLMFNKEIPTILLQLFDVIEQVKKNISSKFDNVIISKAKTSYEHGFYLRDKDGKLLLFFGVWYELWQKKEKPLCIAIQEHSSIPEYVKTFHEHFENCEEYSNWQFNLVSEAIFTPDIIKIISTEISDLIEKQLMTNADSF